MMKISPVNPVVHESIKKYLTKDKFGTANFFDYDRCQYGLFRSPDEPEVLKFAFNCTCFDQIMANGGQEMLDDLYKENQLPKENGLPEFQITLGIDTSSMAKTQKVKKTMTEEEQNKVREENEKIRIVRDAEADKIAAKFACFKRDFMGAPIRSAIKMIEAKKDGFKPCQIDYRMDESFWVFGTKDDVIVTFDVNFDNHTDQSLARIFLLEMMDAKRNVQNAQPVFYHDKAQSDQVMTAFPKVAGRKTSNGSISFKVDKSAIFRAGSDPNLPLSQLIGFRQYLKNHLDALKISIHSRLRKRVNAMELIIKQARRDEESAVTYKDKHGGENIKVAKEEKKKEEVFKFR